MMARIRSLKPEFWTSEQIMNVPPLARLLFIGLWTFCDDGGNHPASPRTLKAEVFPGDDITPTEVDSLIGELLANDLIGRYDAHGKQFWTVTGWHKHQRIDKPTYRYPNPEESASNTRGLVEDSSNGPQSLAAPSPTERSGEDRSGEERRSTPSQRTRKTAMPADFQCSERVKTWAAEKGFSQLDEHLEAFKAKCAAKGYTYADWDAAFMEAIREDWAGLRSAKHRSAKRTPTPEDFAGRDYGQGGKL